MTEVRLYAIIMLMSVSFFRIYLKQNFGTRKIKKNGKNEHNKVYFVDMKYRKEGKKKICRLPTFL